MYTLYLIYKTKGLVKIDFPTYEEAANYALEARKPQLLLIKDPINRIVVFKE